MVPSAPAAPPTFSTTTGWPRSLRICSAARRAMMSVLPPAANGTIRRMGRFGYCAQALVRVAAATAAARKVFQVFMLSPRFCSWDLFDYARVKWAAMKLEAPASAAHTPMMQQYFALKAEY